MLPAMQLLSNDVIYEHSGEANGQFTGMATSADERIINSFENQDATTFKQRRSIEEDGKVVIVPIVVREPENEQENHETLDQEY